MQLSHLVQKGLDAELFLECSPIQERAIPLGRSGLGKFGVAFSFSKSRRENLTSNIVFSAKIC